jgi:hypothetical protein
MYDLAIEFPPGTDGARFLDTQVALANAVVLRLLRDILNRLFAMLIPQDRDKIRLPMLTTVDESDNMITVPLVTCPYLPT